MQFSFKILIFVLFFVSIVNAQDLTRKQKLQKIDELNSQIKALETDILLPDAKDSERAQKEGFDVFRIMPRERYDHKLTVQGGGSYYSFTTKSHDYQKIAQIGLEQNYLKVGFAGADYGFIADLGETPLTEITKEAAEVNFLLNYKPPTNEPEVRIEQRKTWSYEVDGLVFKDRIAAVVGHTYVLRAISFGNADVLVAFKVHRKDSDGSLIIFWKLIENFESPNLKTTASTEQNSRRNLPSAIPNGEELQRVQNILLQKGFYNVTVDASTIPMTLRGTVPKGKLAEVIQAVIDANGEKPVRNEIIEQ